MPIFLTCAADTVFVYVLALVLRLVVVAIWYPSVSKRQHEDLMCWQYLELARFISAFSVSLWAL